MINLENIKEGNWVVFRNGEIEQVLNQKDISELTLEDIVSVWDYQPTRGAIISKIKKGSFINFRDGRREQVEKINSNANRFHYYIKTKDSIGYYFNDGRRYTTESEADIVSVEC